MPYIDLPEGFPGIRSLFMYSPDTAKPLNDLVQTLLHDPATSTLTPGKRELIAAYTSSLNECKYCATTHGAIAKTVGKSGRLVTPEMIQTAREQGATDRELHDTVLIAALFSLYNRYVDGLATVTPDEPAFYDRLGSILQKKGYLPSEDRYAGLVQ